MKNKSELCSTGHGTGVQHVAELAQLLRPRPRLRALGRRVQSAKVRRYHKQVQDYVKERKAQMEASNARRKELEQEARSKTLWGRTKTLARKLLPGNYMEEV